MREEAGLYAEKRECDDCGGAYRDGGIGQQHGECAYVTAQH
jgi:hypothetical protein